MEKQVAYWSIWTEHCQAIALYWRHTWLIYVLEGGKQITWITLGIWEHEKEHGPFENLGKIFITARFDESLYYGWRRRLQQKAKTTWWQVSASYANEFATTKIFEAKETDSGTFYATFTIYVVISLLVISHSITMAARIWMNLINVPFYELYSLKKFHINIFSLFFHKIILIIT